jgi:hypothetical protein
VPFIASQASCSNAVRAVVVPSSFRPMATGSPTASLRAYQHDGVALLRRVKPSAADIRSAAYATATSEREKKGEQKTPAAPFHAAAVH